MILLLPAALAACDRQSQPPEQDNAQVDAGISGEVPATSGEAKGGSKDSAFHYKLDRGKAGAPAPDFTFLDPDGGESRLQDFAGRPLLVNLWATWCAPCVAEMPTLDRIAATHGAKGLAVLTISQDNQGMKAVKPFFEKHKLPNLKGYADPENRLGFHYATGQLPTTIVYDAQGKEMVRVVGAMDWESAEGRALIDAAMAS
jgi:thiol-disulfide isomerase/thioredoxin